MKKKLKIALTITSIVLIIIFILMFYAYTNRTKFYKEETIGNSAGNIYNNGYFCESEDRIYFKNLSDEGKLYSMSKDLDDFKVISGDNVSYISVNGPYIYYNRSNLHNSAANTMFKINNVGAYRCNLDGSSIVDLYTEPTGVVSQYGNNIFYQHYDEKTGLTLYKVKIDGSDEEKISDTPIVPGCFKDGKMYYSSIDNNHFIMIYEPETGKNYQFLDERSVYPIISGDYIYYMDIDNNYGISRYPLKGGEPEVVIDERCATYNISISGKYIFYQTDASDNNALCKYNLETKQSNIIVSGNYADINITSDYIFFTKFGTNECFYIENGKSFPKKFSPNIISE